MARRVTGRLLHRLRPRLVYRITRGPPVLSALKGPTFQSSIPDPTLPRPLARLAQLEAVSPSFDQSCSNTEDTVDRTRKVDMAQQILYYKFQNEDLLWEALQAPGSTVVQGNKGLASLGDAVVTLIIKLDCYMMKQHTGETSAFLGRHVNNARLAALCDITGLTACINGGTGQCSVSPRTRADTVEAVIGAVYLDGGIENARLAMQALHVIKRDGF